MTDVAIDLTGFGGDDPEWQECAPRIMPVRLVDGSKSPWFTTLLYRRRRHGEWEYRMPTDDEQNRYEIGNML